MHLVNKALTIILNNHLINLLEAFNKRIRSFQPKGSPGEKHILSFKKYMRSKQTFMKECRQSTEGDLP